MMYDVNWNTKQIVSTIHITFLFQFSSFRCSSFQLGVVDVALYTFGANNKHAVPFRSRRWVGRSSSLFIIAVAVLQ
jgi:hypothetical protein